MYGAEKAAEQKVQMKLMSDPNSLTTTMLVNPEVLNDASPSLPLQFPKELIPKELCEKQLNLLLSCLLDNEFNNVECEDFQFKFFECKKWRDSLLFKRIEQWEVSNFDKMNENEKNMYLGSIKMKKFEFIDKYEKVEVVPKNRGKRIRITSDIEQLNWRIKYLENNFNTTYYV
jgi:hypothetical protein